jgi:PIN domain nuclease of toxin-antitoxin system
VRLLLDTHAFLWWTTDDPRLPDATREAVAGAGRVVFSAASGWELAIKVATGRLTLPGPVDRFVTAQLALNAFEVLPVSLRHALGVASLPAVHTDPFDRLLVSQALAEGMTIVTADRRIAGYPVEVLW